VEERDMFASLKRQKTAVRLDSLPAAFAERTAKQGRDVFADTVGQPVKKARRTSSPTR
jgi:hypothetical protein